MHKHVAMCRIYILDKRSNGCLINPVLNPTNLNESVILRLLTTEADSEELCNEFVFIASQDGSKDSEINRVAGKAFLKTVKFKTPSKLKGQFYQASSSNLVDIVSNFTTSSDEASGQPEVKFESTEELSHAVSDLVSYHKGLLKRNLPSMAGTVDSLGDSLSDKTDLIYRGIQQVRQLEGTIGKQSQELKQKNTAPTMEAVFWSFLVVPKFFQAFFIFLSVLPTTHNHTHNHTRLISFILQIYCLLVLVLVLVLVHLQNFMSSASSTAASNNDNDDNNSNNDPMNQPRLLYNVNYDIIFIRSGGKDGVLAED
jgi:hypothetical protein